MFTVSLAPTSAPSRWYSKPLGIQEEYEELGFLEAKFVHEREQALEVQCQTVYPVTSNNNSMEDPSMDETGMQDDVNDSGILPSTEMDGTSLDDTPMERRNQPYGEPHDLLDYLQHREQYSQDGSNQSLSRTAHRYSTPDQITELPHLYTTPDPPRSPNLMSYLSPPPTGRSLRQYLDDSSRGFMEPMDMMDRLVRFDDDNDNDNGSYGDADPIHIAHDDDDDDYYQQREMDNGDLSSTSTRRSNFFD